MTSVFLLTVHDDYSHEFSDQFEILAWSADRELIEAECKRRQKEVDDAARAKGLAEYRPDQDAWDMGPYTRSGIAYGVTEVQTQLT